jgi:hypothetical protein
MTARHGPPGRKRNGPRRSRLTVAPPPAGTDTASVLAASVRRRQAAAAGMPLLPCGLCTDPLPCDLARWCPAYDGPRPRPGLTTAADHLDSAGLCVCWTVPRRHRATS